MKRIYKIEYEHALSEITSMQERKPKKILGVIGHIDSGSIDGIYIIGSDADGIFERMGFSENKKRYVEDITEDVIFGRYHVYNRVIEEYLDENLTIDSVIEKVNRYGMPSLTKRDLKKLEEDNI